MKGKILFVAGAATGYVLGTRAGRKRYEQIRSAWLSVWHTAPVQNQVQKVEGYAKARLSELPSAVVSGVGATISALTNRKATPGEKLDATIKSAQKTVDEAAKAVADAAEQAQAAAADDSSSEKPAARKKSSGSQASAKKSSRSSSSATKSTSRKPARGTDRS
ncbi:MAG: hypothetical protein ACTJHU_05825 [Mycetocola sp.]